MEWAEKAHVDKEKSDAQQTESDTKLMAFMHKLQDDQAKRQKEVDEDFVHRVAELDKQHVQQDERNAEMQRRLHVSQTSAQSTALYQFHSNPLVSVHAPPLHTPLHALLHVLQLSQLSGPHFVPPHLLIPVNALLQVPVVDFAQQHMIAQIPVTRQENEVARLEQNLRDSASDPDEAIQLSQLLKICCAGAWSFES